jgi:hypothetical protein
MLKISQKQYTFIMHLIDEIGLFIDVLERNKIQADLIKQKLSSSDDSSNPTKITICLTTSTTFTLAIIDSLADEIPDLPTPRSSSLLEAEIEPNMPYTSDVNVGIDLITTPEPIIASTAKVEPSTLNKNLKKSKFEENIQRELGMVPKGTRGSSQSLSMNTTDYGDETASQLDSTEDLDADLDLSLFINESEEKVTRIELDDDDCISLTEKMYMPRPISESVGFLVRK